MKLRLVALAIAMLAGALSGCAKPLLVTPAKDATFAAKPANCPVAFEDIDDPRFEGGVTPYHDGRRYVDVGYIQVGDAPQGWNVKLQSRLRPEACKLGGDVILWTGHSPPAVGGSAAVFVVYRAKESAAP